MDIDNYNKPYTYDEIKQIFKCIKIPNIENAIYVINTTGVSKNYILITKLIYINIFNNVTNRNKKIILDTIPSHIIENIYLGKLDHVLDKSILEKYNIKAIINLSCYTYKIHGIKILNINIQDLKTEKISKYFNASHKFLDKAHSTNKDSCILIHCKAGISRSATIVISYLMYKYKYDIKKAYEYVLKKRPIINPNEGFLNELKLYNNLIN